MHFSLQAVSCYPAHSSPLMFTGTAARVSSSDTRGALQKGLNGDNGKEDNLEKN